MKRYLPILLTLMLCVSIFSGCQCSHEWTAADCAAPKTCTKCGVTEGEVLGHSWAEATCETPKTCERCGLTEGDILSHTWTEVSCAAPKTCERCGLTEGEALEHTWVEANYQAPKTCTVCGTTEGEPWRTDFDEMGIRFNVEEVGVAYPMIIDGKEFTYTVESYEVFASDDTHPAKEGYEWRVVSHTTECLQGAVPTSYYPNYTDFNNHYDIESFNNSLSMDDGYNMRFTVNHLGVDYTECLFRGEMDRLETTETGWKHKETLAFCVPVGFDGMFVCEGPDIIVGDYNQEYKNFYADENTRFFQLK